MTQKELLYLEDAIGHESNIILICKEMINYLEDEELKTFIDEELTKHVTMKDELINMLEVKSNE
jgi:hypothetical protein